MTHLKQFTDYKIMRIANSFVGRELRAIIFLLFLSTYSFSQYRLNIIPLDKDSTVIFKKVAIQTSFKTRHACESYIENLTGSLQSKGYAAASIDSVYYDTTEATIRLFVGEFFQVADIHTTSIDKKILEQSGWNDRSFQSKPLNIVQLQGLRLKILDHLENNGYPFAKLQLDSIVFANGKLSASLLLDKGPLYKIDSIRLYGSARISNRFLQRYLEIRNGGIYRKSKLQNISRKLLDLPYMEEQQTWDLTMLGTGSILNLYLKPKKSSQVNVLIGLLPSNEQTTNTKLLVTGEANINLRNALGNGELIGLNWQQIQVKSPRLNLAFQQPYLFGSPFGISTTFDLLKKDSFYVNLNFLLGMQYALPGQQTGRVFIQNLKTNLLSVDTNLVKSSKELPPVLDMSSINLGIDYEVSKTNYRFNPKRGSELAFTVSAGTRTIRKNDVIVKLHDPAFSYGSLYDSIGQNSYQFRVKINAIHYFQLGRQSTLKTAMNVGWFQSPVVFQNELFQIGGYKLLRGFDEESIYASSYSVGTLEYRYLVGLNSFLFSFIDAGISANKMNLEKPGNWFLGGGLGMAFETKAGIFNISYAVGKRDDARFDLRQSKIHLGYVNYF